MSTLTYTKEDLRCFQKHRCGSRINVKLGGEAERREKKGEDRGGDWSGSKYFVWATCLAVGI